MSNPDQEGPLSGPAQTRQKIVQATLDCLRQFGAEKTSLEDVSQRAGVHRQTIYRQFAGREALLQAAMADRVQHLAGAVKARIGAADSLKEAVVAVTMTTLSMARQDAALMSLLHAMQPFSDNRLITGGSTVAEDFAMLWLPLFDLARERGEISRQRRFEDFSLWLRGVQYIVLLHEELAEPEQERLLHLFLQPGFDGELDASGGADDRETAHGGVEGWR